MVVQMVGAIDQSNFKPFIDAMIASPLDAIMTSSATATI